MWSVAGVYAELDAGLYHKQVIVRPLFTVEYTSVSEFIPL